jgi:signal transduction histidine kinase/DNA-binding response OmpR family regulator
MDYEKALEFTLKSLDVLEQAGRIEETVTVLNMMGVLYMAMDNIGTAREYFEKALHIAEKEGNAYYHSLVLNNIADSYKTEGLHEKAREYYERALDIAETHGIKFSVAFALKGIGDLDFAAGSLPDAADKAEHALALAREAQRFSIIHEALYLNAQIAHKKQDAETACSFLLESVALSRKAGNMNNELDSERLLVLLYKELEDFESALAHSEEVEQLSARISKIDQQKIEVELRLRYDTEKRDRELELHRLKNIELASAQVKAEKASLAKSDFLAIMSHELRTPMNGVIGAVELLLNTPMVDEQQEFARVISSSAQSLMDIIRDIMDISKIEQGTIELECLPFDLEEVIEQMFRQVTVGAARKQLELILDYPLSLPHLFNGDPTRIKEILVNLVSNAVKFTTEGYILVAVDCTERKNDAAEMTLTVTDTGKGISSELQPVIFDTFTQAEYNISDENKGSGLGLSITRQLVEAMNGSISVSSVPGEGSTFTVSLPLTTTQSDPELPQELLDIQLLVADAHFLSRRIMHDGLVNAGMQCITVANLHEAFETLEHNDCNFAVVNRNLIETSSAASIARIADYLTNGAHGLILLCKISENSRGEICSKSICLMQPVSIRKICSVMQTVMASPNVPHTRQTGTSDLYSDILKLSTGRRCLLVEDNVINQKVTTAILRKLGYDVDIAENGLVAVDMIGRYSYSIVFMDCQMPIMDGYNATRELRARNVTTPIIGVTANAMEDDRDKCLRAGMDDYLPKPVKIASIKALLQRWDN